MRQLWEDATSYSRDERGIRKPDAWELNLSQSGLRIVLFKPRWSPEAWMLSAYWCGGSVFDGHALGTDDLEAAKALALVRVVARFASVVSEGRALVAPGGSPA